MTCVLRLCRTNPTTSYNKIEVVNSSTGAKWSCENPDTRRRDLKQRLNFSGWVMSDWGACHSPSIIAGLDQEMSGDFILISDRTLELKCAAIATPQAAST